MKKVVCILVILFTVSVGFVFAEWPPFKPSIGVGVKYLPYWTNVSGSVPVLTADFTETRQDFGVFGFFDLTYLQIDLGYTFKAESSGTGDISGFDAGGLYSLYDDGNKYGYLDMGLLLKLPFTLGPFTLFPAAGISYRLNLYAQDNDGNDIKDDMSSDQKSSLNQFWIKAGLGMDINLGKTFYLRPMALLGYKIRSTQESDFYDDAKDIDDDASLYTIGLDLSVSAGFRF